MREKPNEYTENELLPVFTLLLVPPPCPLGTSPARNKGSKKGQVMQSIATASENGKKSRGGWKINLVGMRIENNVLGNIEEARLQSFLGTRGQK